MFYFSSSRLAKMIKICLGGSRTRDIEIHRCFGDLYISVSRLCSIHLKGFESAAARGTAPKSIIGFRNKIYDGFHSDLKAYRYQQRPLILEAFRPLRSLYS